MKKHLMILRLGWLSLCLALFAGGVQAKTDRITAVYFYSPTCSSCIKATNALKACQSAHPELVLRKYNIAESGNRALLDAYCLQYGMPNQEAGIVPILFVGNAYTAELGNKDIVEAFILREGVRETRLVVVPGESDSGEAGTLHAYTLAGVLTAGFVNGLSPCSLSLLLFFTSLLMLNQKILMRAGLLFCLGKFLGFFALGTLVYSILGELELPHYNGILKAFTLLFIGVFVALNLKDALAAGHEKYKKLVLQLPKPVKDGNHRLIHKISAVRKVPLLLFLSILLGAFVSLGEFLCTGQIYLAAIVTVLQSIAFSGLRSIAFLFFILYDIGFILPLLLLLVGIAKGKDSLELSEAIRKRMPLIKLVSAFVFAAIGIYIFI